MLKCNTTAHQYIADITVDVWNDINQSQGSWFSGEGVIANRNVVVNNLLTFC